MNIKAQKLRDQARSLRQSAQYAQGACYHQEMQQAQAMEAEAGRIEQAEKIQAERRQKTLAKIHIAKKELGLDDDTYREMLQQLTGKTSCKELNQTQLGKVFLTLRKKGYQAKKPQNYPGRPNNTDSSPQLKKIEALLTEANRPWEYARSMTEKMYQKKRLEFCNSRELGGIITALIKDAERHGRRTE